MKEIGEKAWEKWRKAVDKQVDDNSEGEYMVGRDWTDKQKEIGDSKRRKAKEKERQDLDVVEAENAAAKWVEDQDKKEEREASREAKHVAGIYGEMGSDAGQFLAYHAARRQVVDGMSPKERARQLREAERSGDPILSQEDAEYQAAMTIGQRLAGHGALDAHGNPLRGDALDAAASEILGQQRDKFEKKQLTPTRPKKAPHEKAAHHAKSPHAKPAKMGGLRNVGLGPVDHDAEVRKLMLDSAREPRAAAFQVDPAIRERMAGLLAARSPMAPPVGRGGGGGPTPQEQGKLIEALVAVKESSQQLTQQLRQGVPSLLA